MRQYLPGRLYVEQFTQKGGEDEEMFTQVREGTKNMIEESKGFTNENEDTDERKGKCAAKLMKEYMEQFMQKSEQ